MNEPADIKSACEHCGGHIQFPPEAVGMAVDCPHCGWKTQLVRPAPAATPPEVPPHPRRASRPALLAMAILLGLAIGTLLWLRQRARSGSPAPPAGASNAPVSAAVQLVRRGSSTNSLTIGEISLEKSGSSKVVYAVGRVVNDLARQRFGLRIELDLFDAGGDKVGSATDYLSVLEPGKEWRFKALVLESKAVRAKLATIREDQ